MSRVCHGLLSGRGRGERKLVGVGVKRKKQEEGSFLVGEWRMKEEESQGRGFRPYATRCSHITERF